MKVKIFFGSHQQTYEEIIVTGFQLKCCQNIIHGFIQCRISLSSLYANPIYSSGIDAILNDPEMRGNIALKLFRQVLGILQSANDEWKSGMLTQVEYILAAETFDNFLSHSEEYHKANKKIEASILASAILEDTLKKIAKRNAIAQNLTLDPLIDELTKKNIITPVKAKKFKSLVAIRNSSFHAKWDEFDIKDVGHLIKGVKELIEDYL